MKRLMGIVFIMFSCVSYAQFTKAKPDFKNDDYSKKYVERTDLKFGMELVRLDKNNKEILMRKLEYPLKFIGKDWDEKWQTNFSNYAGRISLPLEIYNPKKKELASKSLKVSNAKINYILSVTPIQKKGDTYTCQLLYMVNINNISFKEYNGVKYPNETAGSESMNPIDIKVGEKVRIDLAGSFSTLWGIEDTVNGKPFTIRANEDYNDYFNDYMIISLENEGTDSSRTNIKGKTFNGILVDKLSGKPVANGMVYLLNNNLINSIAISDSLGLFSFQNVSISKVKIFAKKLGYNELTFGPFPISKIDTFKAVVKMNPDLLVLNEIVIKEKRIDAWLSDKGFYKRREFGKGKFYGPKELDNNFSNSVFDMLKKLPGIRIYDHYNSGVEFLGESKSDYLLVYLDGFRIKLNEIRYLSPNEIAAIEYYSKRDDIPLQYSGVFKGNANYGVVLLWSKK